MGTKSSQNKIVEDIEWLFKERNKVAHRGRLSIDENSTISQVGKDFENQLYRVERIVRGVILATIFAAKSIDERYEGKNAFQQILSTHDNLSNKNLIRKNIPRWIFDEIEKLYALAPQT